MKCGFITVPRVLLRRRSPASWLVILGLVLVLLIEPTVRIRSRFSVARPPLERDIPFATSCKEPDVSAPREDAVIVMLVRNKELKQATHSINQLEQAFNKWFHYPVVFLNNDAWTDEFISGMRSVVSGDAIFEVLPNGTWGFPDPLEYMTSDKSFDGSFSFDIDAARKSMEYQGAHGVNRGAMESYHHMCRFFSGPFFDLPVLSAYRYYWRVEPGVDFLCQITYDPFREMRLNDKVYGWAMAQWESPLTVPTLFRVTADYMAREGISETPLWRTILQPEWQSIPLRLWRAAYDGVRDAYGDKWSLCHYWSNFEIADLDFFRGPEYMKYYRHLLAHGGFYNERASKSLS